MAETKTLPRKFKYEQMMLDDIDSDATPEDILQLYSDHYPALVGAGIEGPKLTDDALVYEFVTRIGTKG